MNRQPLPQVADQRATPQSTPRPKYQAPVTLLKATLVAASLTAALTTWSVWGRDWTYGINTTGSDQVSADESDARFENYLKAPLVVLSQVDQQDWPKALDSMNLPDTQRRNLQADLMPAPLAPPADVQAMPAVQPGHDIKLVWLTLWDTDNEDGDAVTVQSAGYARTITLTKQAITLAIPVLRDTPIKIKGVRDGEGGGITVGVASGSALASFPIMSTGQVLALRARLP